MPQIQPPNTQTLRPQHLTQVGHEGNPVETCGLAVTGVLDSPSYYSCEGADPGGPIPYPAVGSGGPGGSGGNEATLPLGGGSTDVDCEGAGTASITVTGGTAPYTFSASSGTVTNNGDGTATWSPPANPWAGSLATLAYKFCSRYITFSCLANGVANRKFSCYGNVLQECTNAGSSCAPNDGCDSCHPGDGSCPNGCIAGRCTLCSDGGTPTDPYQGQPLFSDLCALLDSTRSGYCQSSNDSLCKPCEIYMRENAVTVTVTDSNGLQLIIAITSKWADVP